MRQTSKRFLSMTISLVLIVSALIVYFQLIIPEYDTIRSLRNEVFTRQNFYERQKQVVNQFDQLYSLYQNQGQVRDLLTFALPQNDDVTTAFVQVSNLALNSRLNPQSFTINVVAPQLPKTAAGAKKPLVPPRPLGTVVVHTRLSGAYEDLKTFLKGVESNVRLLDLQSIDVQAAPNATNIEGAKGPSTPNGFTYSVAIVAHYQGQVGTSTSQAK